jgi:hypothetical protein
MYWPKGKMDIVSVIKKIIAFAVRCIEENQKNSDGNFDDIFVDVKEAAEGSPGKKLALV